MRHVIAMLVLAAGCAGMGGADSPDAGQSSDGGTGCVIAYDPIDPTASPILPIRVYTNLANTQGVLTFAWNVRFNNSPVAFTSQAPDGSQIGFIAATPGLYNVQVDITGPTSCFASTTINVGAPGAIPDLFRLRAVASPTLAPPQEFVIQVKGGADADRAIALDSGIAVNGVVLNSTTSAGISAYLKFMPASMPTAFTEVFSSSTGAYSLRLLPINHDVLVVPTSTTLAPKLVPWTAVPFTSQLSVGPGTVVSGIVRGPGGAGFGGAKVLLSSGGVPSTLATTAADGSFSVRTDFPTNATSVTVKVTPPAASGLPRLEASGDFNLAQQVQINYASSLATCDLANTPVQRGGVNRANARVTAVGTLAGTAGTVIAGITVNATNTVRVTATADGSGRLPTMIVPRGSLSAVTEVSMGDHAVSVLDTSACTVTAVNAPAMTVVTGTTSNVSAATLDNIRIEAELVGPLALAGVPPVQAVANSSGAFSLPLSAGGRYTVRFTDPNARAAPLVATDVAPGGVPTNAVLPKALAISGEVSIVNNSNPVIGASVQILCAACTGLDVARPIAETATDSLSRYRIAVPDPGTM